MMIRCQKVSKGDAIGEAMVSKEPLSFLGGVDPRTGLVIEKGHPLEGRSITGKVLIFPNGKGSTVGAYVIYQLQKEGRAPAAMVNLQADAMVASGAIISGIPMVHRLEGNPFEIENGAKIHVNADKGYIEVLD